MRHINDTNKFQPVPWGVRDAVWLLTLVFIAPLILFALLVAASHAGLLPSVVRETIRTNDFVVNMAYTTLTVIIEIILLYLLIVRKYQANLRVLGVRAFSIWKAIVYVLGTLVTFTAIIVLVFGLVAWLLPSINLQEQQKIGFEYGRNGLGLVLSFIITVIISPIIEELYFRGVALPAIAQKHGYLLGLLSSSAVFAVLHAQANIIIYTFVLGVLLAVMYKHLNSIVPGIILHSLNNLLAFVVLAGIIR